MFAYICRIDQVSFSQGCYSCSYQQRVDAASSTKFNIRFWIVSNHQNPIFASNFVRLHYQVQCRRRRLPHQLRGLPRRFFHDRLDATSSWHLVLTHFDVAVGIRCYELRSIFHTLTPKTQHLIVEELIVSSYDGCNVPGGVQRLEHIVSNLLVLAKIGRLNDFNAEALAFITYASHAHVVYHFVPPDMNIDGCQVGGSVNMTKIGLDFQMPEFIEKDLSALG